MAENILINGPVPPQMIIDLAAAVGNHSGPGAHSIFLGQVRSDVSGNRFVTAIEYSAYPDMVNKEAGLIKKEILDRFSDVTGIKIFHSTGIVPAGKISLLVTVSSGHRKQAFEACKEIVEMIKERLPVWKREIFNDDSSEWKSVS